MPKRLSVPFNDLLSQYNSIKTEIDDAIASVIKSSSFIRGEAVDKFENDFSFILGADFCVSCANGTDALFIALKAFGIKEGDEVIAPAHSWISTASAITQSGGKVVFCDTDPLTFTIDVNKIEEKITSRTVGIIPVHLYGHPAEMDEILVTAKKYGLWVLEDCAQAHLANYKGKKVGTIGDAAAFSFYPGKNLGAMGDAGAITTNNAAFAQKAAMIARHGGLRKGEHFLDGINSRMDGIQAAILCAKLPYLQKWTDRRLKIASKYSNGIIERDRLALPKTNYYVEHVWHLFVIKSNDRNRLATDLRNNGIQTVVNYPTALPFLPVYSALGHKPEDFPNTHYNQSRVLSLPIYPDMPDVQINHVIETLNRFDN